jgi:hypothetical protein
MASSLSCLLPVMIQSSPFLAKMAAIALPNPEVAPVISIFLFIL